MKPERRNTMRYWKIVSSMGIIMGTYPGNTHQEALDAMAQDAGYLDAYDAAASAGGFEGTIEEVEK